MTWMPSAMKSRQMQMTLQLKILSATQSAAALFSSPTCALVHGLIRD